MRLGFSLGSLLGVDEIFDCARVLADYKVDSIWVPETWGMDCSMVLSSVAKIATKPNLGTSIMNIYSRSPSLIAMSAATLDTISQGRFILGLGTSSQAIVQDWHGMNFSQPLQRMREYVEIIRLVVSGQKVSYTGKLFRLQNFTLLIQPPRKNIPIYLAAINQKMTQLAWEIADGVIFYLRPLEEMKKTIPAMQSRKKIDVASQIITCVSDDSEEAIKRAKQTIAFYVSVGKIYREFLASNGFNKETSNIYDEYKKTGFKNNFEFVTDTMMRSLSAAGTPQDVKQSIERFTDAGVDLPILQFNPVGNVKESFGLLTRTLAGDIK